MWLNQLREIGLRIVQHAIMITKGVKKIDALPVAQVGLSCESYLRKHENFICDSSALHG